jgi:hypothetical protein
MLEQARVLLCGRDTALKLQWKWPAAWLVLMYTWVNLPKLTGHCKVVPMPLHLQAAAWLCAQVLVNSALTASEMYLRAAHFL